MDTRWSIKKAYCRAYQMVMKMGMNTLPWDTPKIMKGEGTSAKLPAAVKRRGFQKALIVTGPTLIGRGLLDPMLAQMEEQGLLYEIYNKMEQNPTDANVEEGVELFCTSNCDCMIAFGGGAPMDCAKAIGARLARPKKSVEQLQGLFKVIKPIPMIFAVPTTAGSGSETTIASVITIEETHHKAAINDICLVPKYAVLDPLLTVGISPEVTAATGMDALSHAVEAYVNEKYNSEIEKELCKKAVRLIYDNLYQAYIDGENIEARQNMQEAAFCAGRAFTRSSVGYVHAIGHTLGGLYGTPHGLAMAILLPHVLRAYGAAAQERLAELSDVCGLTEEKELVPAKAAAFIHWIEEMKEKMDLPKYPEMMLKKDIKQIAKWAEKEGNPLYPVPVIWSRAEFERFLWSIVEPETERKR